MRLEGVFVNLDRSRQRRAAMERQLHDLGCSDFITRFPAIDGRTMGPFANVAENGVWACRESHAQVLGKSDDSSALIVLEDDVELSRQFPEIVNQRILDAFVASYPQCDMLFLDCISFHTQAPLLLALSEMQMKNRVRGDVAGAARHSLEGVSILDARTLYAYCSASYIVTPKGKRVLRELYSESASSNAAVDILFRNWIAEGRINANLTIPFLATPPFDNDSTIDYGKLDYLTIDHKQFLYANAIRRLLFAGDHGLNLETIAAMLQPAECSEEYTLGMQLYQSCRSLST